MLVSRVKRIMAIALAVAGGVSIVAVLLVSGLVVLSSGSGADPADAFSEVPLVPENLEDLVTWLPDEELVREIEPNTRAFVESTWVSAWQRIDAAERTSSRELIDTWFMPGVANHVAVAEATEANPASIQQLGHTFEATFYSLDGSVLGLTIFSDLERRFEDGPALRSTDTFEVVFLLSDGNWRIQHATLTEAR